MNPNSTTMSARKSHSQGFPIEGSAATATATLEDTPPMTAPERLGVLVLVDAVFTELVEERAVRTSALWDDALAVFVLTVTGAADVLPDGAAVFSVFPEDALATGAGVTDRLVVLAAAVCAFCPFDESVPVISDARTEENVHKNRVAAIKAMYGIDVLACVIIAK